MLDIGWPELMVIAAITIVVVGPREIPRVLRTVNGYVRKARSLASEFHSSIEDMAREADLEDLKKKMKETGDEFTGDFEKSVDPTGDVSRSMREVKDSVNKRYGDDKNRAPGNSVTPPAEKTERKTDQKAGQQTAEKSGAASASSDSTQKASAPKTATSKAAAPKASAPKASAPKASAKKAAGKGTGTKKAAAKKATAKKTAAKTTAAKKAPAKKSDAG
ncbi:twin-arginine translocase subunit TatB [Marivibrio halodurans]|uniref:Sec-independent protein translocase protein TatB n=1 Tax=Marivibrio halodurans TaxID=2039722 RepID=A0A8J7SLK8_9PROT|nr:Sec-independent protein translocase protein TatB [Marivibrio halodurans]MBP5856923.1 twin-arginine translocase subunit TatB [Marivibrio halodurans]